VLDDERLKFNKRFGKDYFDELLESTHEIRASISWPNGMSSVAAGMARKNARQSSIVILILM
jgi:hypothetical protein